MKVTVAYVVSHPSSVLISGTTRLRTHRWFLVNSAKTMLQRLTLEKDAWYTGAIHKGRDLIRPWRKITLQSMLAQVLPAKCAARIHNNATEIYHDNAMLQRNRVMSSPRFASHTLLFAVESETWFTSNSRQNIRKNIFTPNIRNGLEPGTLHWNWKTAQLKVR